MDGLEGNMRNTECEKIIGMIPDYFESGLGPDETAAVEEHLAGCGECRAELEKYRRAAELVRLAAYEPPDEIKINVGKKIARYNRARSIKRGILRYGGVAAAAVVVLTVTLRALPLSRMSSDAAQASVIASKSSGSDAAVTGEEIYTAPAEAAEEMILYSANDSASEIQSDTAVETDKSSSIAKKSVRASLFAAPAAAAPTMGGDIPEAEEAYEPAENDNGISAEVSEMIPEAPAPAPMAASGMTEDEAAIYEDQDEMLSASAVTADAAEKSAEAPLIFQDRESGNALIEQYAPEYKDKPGHVYIANGKLEENADFLEGFEKIESDGYILYVSNDIESAADALRNSVGLYPDWTYDTAIDTDNGSEYYTLIFDFGE